MSTGTPTDRGRRRERSVGQGLVEFSLLVPVLTLLLMGMLEFGFVFDHELSLGYATREGARTGAALANGGGAPGCGAGQSPNAASVDPAIVAAVQRILTAPGSLVALARVPEIRIYKADANGAETAGLVDIWRWVGPGGGGQTVDGLQLQYVQTASGWPACSRDNGADPDSLGVSLRYTYVFVTPLANVMGMFGGGPATLQMTDRTVMALNPS